jgi:uncharacterized integral membrane protein
MTFDDEHESVHDRSIRARQTIRLVMWVLIVAAVVVFAAANTQQVAVDWIFGDSEIALWIVIAGSVVVGALLGYVARWRRH